MTDHAGLKELAERLRERPVMLKPGETQLMTLSVAAGPSVQEQAADAILALLAEIERMQEVLKTISGQKKTTELETVADVEYADFEQGYDDMIDFARATLGEK